MFRDFYLMIFCTVTCSSQETRCQLICLYIPSEPWAIQASSSIPFFYLLLIFNFWFRVIGSQASWQRLPISSWDCPRALKCYTHNSYWWKILIQYIVWNVSRSRNSITDLLPNEELLKNFSIKLLIKNKLIICALGNLHYQIWLKWHPSQEEGLNMSWHENQDSSSGRAPG